MIKLVENIEFFVQDSFFYSHFDFICCRRTFNKQESVVDVFCDELRHYEVNFAM